MGPSGILAPVTDARANAFTVLDWIGTALAASALVGLAALPLGGFRAMFRDLGSPETLPLLTRVALLPGFTLVAALPSAALLALGLWRSQPLVRRRVGVALSFVLACVAIGVTLLAMYLPVFAMAGAIKAD